MNDLQSPGFTVLSAETAETVVVPWYLNLEPVRSNYLRRKAKSMASETLLARSAEAVKAVWAGTNVDNDLVATVSQIVAGECEWPNCLFVPDDKCSVIFCDVGRSMNTAEATLSIEQRLGVKLSDDIWSELLATSYGELMERLHEALKKVPRQESK